MRSPSSRPPMQISTMARVRSDVAELVRRTLARRDHRAVLAHAAPWPASRRRAAARTRARTPRRGASGRRARAPSGGRPAAPVRARAPCSCAGRARIFGVLRAMHRLVETTRKPRISRNHQRAVAPCEPERAEHVGPERAELVDVVVDRLVLLDDGADRRRDADHRQQRDREAHRRHQLDGVAQPARAGAGLRCRSWRGSWEDCRGRARRARSERPVLTGLSPAGFDAADQRRPAM